jgi:hypothetical protein
MNDVATAYSLQEWSALLSYVCYIYKNANYMFVGCQNRVITRVQGAVCLLYVSRHSIQNDNHTPVAYRSTGYSLQIYV